MELIKINNGTDSQTVSARELHKFLQNTDNVNTWFKRQSERAMLEEGVDFTSIAFLQPSGQTAIDYAISLNSAKEIAMLNGGEKGKEARQYFIEAEKQLRLKYAAKPMSKLEAARELVKALEANERHIVHIDNLSSAFMHQSNWLSILKVAKFNELNEKHFNWRKLKETGKKLGFEIKKMPSRRFEYQNLYHIDVFKVAYPTLNYNFPDDYFIDED